MVRQRAILTRLLLLSGFWIAVAGIGPAAADTKGAGGSAPSALPDFRTYETSYFTLETDSDTLFAKELSEQLDGFASQAQTHFKKLFKRELPVPRLTLTVFERREDYSQFTSEHAPHLTNNGGYYDGALKRVVSHRYNTNVALFFHELTHGMLGELFDDHHFYRYTHKEWPVWFDEGLAEYLAYSPTASKQPGLSHPGKYAILFNAIREKKLPDLQEALDVRAEHFSGPNMSMNYAVAWGFLTYLIEEHGESGAMAKYLSSLISGKNGRESFEEAFNTRPETLENDWIAWIKKQVNGLEPREALFESGDLWDWSIHEGGEWRFSGNETRALSSGEYDYLIRNLMPLGDFRLQIQVKFLSGRAGFIFGNNRSGSYPYDYLVDFTRKSTGIRKSKTARHRVNLGDKTDALRTGEWHRIVIEVVDGQLKLYANGETLLDVVCDTEVFSLFGLYVHKGEAVFKNPVLLRGPTPRTR